MSCSNKYPITMNGAGLEGDVVTKLLSGESSEAKGRAA